MRDLVGKVLIVEMKITKQWAENQDFVDEMRGEDLKDDPSEEMPICHADVENEIKKKEIFIKLLNEMFFKHLS
jgi:hypothetical protein